MSGTTLRMLMERLQVNVASLFVSTESVSPPGLLARNGRLHSTLATNISMKKHQTSAVPAELIEQKIYLIRGQKVMLDVDLAEMYEAEVRALNQAVKRNLDRFPLDFMFQLTPEEVKNLTSQIVISSWGGRRSRPYAFTEHGVLMLSRLRSERAVQVNITIMRTFVKLRTVLGAHAEMVRRLNDLEKKYDKQFAVVFEAIRQLMEPAPVPPSRRIGFNVEAENKQS